MEILKVSRAVYAFEVYETKSTFLLIKCSVPKVLIEWTNLFRIKILDLKFSKYQKQSPRGFLKVKTLQNSLKNICDAVFNLINFQAKGL